MTNLPWEFTQTELKAELSLNKLLFINDYTAIAHAVPYLNDDQKRLVTNHTKRRRNKIIIETLQGEIEYIVTTIIKKGKKLKLRNNQIFLVKASNLNFYFVINKSLAPPPLVG